MERGEMYIDPDTGSNVCYMTPSEMRAEMQVTESGYFYGSDPLLDSQSNYDWERPYEAYLANQPTSEEVSAVIEEIYGK